MACDGIYEGDVFTREGVIQWVAERLTPTADPAQVCADLLDEVLRRGSRDNMSAMIILFEDGTAYNQDKFEYIPGPWHSGENDHKFQEAYATDARSAGYDLPTALKLYKEILQKKKEVVQSQSANSNGNNSSEDNHSNYMVDSTDDQY